MSQQTIKFDQDDSTAVIALYGAPGVGKTMCITSFANHVVIQAASRGARKFTSATITPKNLTEYAETLGLIARSKLQAVMLDDFDLMLQHAVREMPASKDLRRKYAQVYDILKGPVERIMSSGKHVIFTLGEIDEIDGTNLVRAMWLPEMFEKWFARHVDLVGWCWRKANEPAHVTFKNTTWTKNVDEEVNGRKTTKTLTCTLATKMRAGWQQPEAKIELLKLPEWLAGQVKRFDGAAPELQVESRDEAQEQSEALLSDEVTA